MIFSVVRLDEYAPPSFTSFFSHPHTLPPNITLPSFLVIFARVGGLGEKRLFSKLIQIFFVMKILKDGAGGARFYFSEIMYNTITRYIWEIAERYGINWQTSSSGGGMRDVFMICGQNIHQSVDRGYDD